MLREREKEFALARHIQLSLLPSSAPDVPGYAFGGAARFAQETGGDYYDYFPVADNSIGLAIGDASGHGIGAAIIVAETRSALRTLCMTHRSPAEILSLLNRRLIDDLPDGQFVTFFFGRLDPTDRTLTYASAGHCTGYVLRPDGSVRLELPSTGLPLGLVRGVKIPNAPPVNLREGESILLFTDGVTEAMSGQGELFRIARMLNVVQEHRHETPAEVCRSIIAAVEIHCKPGLPHDDAAALILEVAAAR